MLTLKIKEILDLALFAGFTIDETHPMSDDEMESEITIQDCPAEGIDDEEGGRIHTEHIAYFSEYLEEGCHPLGDVK